MALEDYSEYRHAVRIWQIVSPLLLLVGTVGNILTIIVLSKRRSRYNSTAVYLCALAISDIVVLNTGLLRQWMLYTFDFDLRGLTSVMCKIHLFLVYWSTQCSSWFLVAMTCERFMGVWLPHKVKQGCTRRAALFVIFAIAGSLMMLNIHWLYGFGNLTLTINHNETEVSECVVVAGDAYRWYFTYTWNWIDLCMFCLIPFLVLLFGHISILLKVFWSRQKTRKQQPVMNQSITSATTKKEITSQLTVMFVLLNVVFFVSTAPISAYLSSEPFWMDSIETEYDNALNNLWWASVNILMYLNNAVNFVLYFLSGSRFRAEVRTLICGGSGRSVYGRGQTTRVDTIATNQTMRTLPGTSSVSSKHGKTHFQATVSGGTLM